MKVRIVVTLDVDPEVWANEYGVDSKRVRDDVLMHLRNTVWEHYVTDLGVARDVRVESSRRAEVPRENTDDVVTQQHNINLARGYAHR